MTHYQVPHLSPHPKMPQSDPLLLGYLSKCPFCHKSCCIHGGGVKNHIQKSPMCQRKHSQMLKSLAARAVQCTHTLGPSSKTSLSLSPTDISPMDTHGPSDPTPITFDQENPFVAMPAGGILYNYDNDGIGGHDANTLTQQFRVMCTHKNAGFIFPGYQQTLWE